MYMITINVPTAVHSETGALLQLHRMLAYNRTVKPRPEQKVLNLAS